MTLVLILTLQSAMAQVKTYDLKKGQAFDVLLFNTIPESKETLNRYFKYAIPVAQKYGYIPQKGFKVIQSPTQGNYWPGTVIIGQWSDFSKRREFVTEITKEVPDFHEMRRAIWSTFFLTYWEVKEDKTVRMDSEKFNVFTAYWEDDSEGFKKFIENWKKRVNQTEGEILLELTDGNSPVGYYYNPEYLSISSWDNREAFEAFYEKNLKMDHTGVKHVNQFIIE